MAAPLPRWSDDVLRVGCGVVVVAVLGIPLFAMAWVRTPWSTDVGFVVPQPIDFDHRHHVQDDGIDCLYCHHDADDAATAGVPSTERCMGCHAQIWNESPQLAPLRQSWREGRPIPWRRVHDLPDFVYFHHGIHTQKGVPCEACHGRVDRMALVHKVETLSMGWCLDCHRDPEPHLRDPSRATEMGATTTPEERARVRRELRVAPPTTCTACHR